MNEFIKVNTFECGTIIVNKSQIVSVYKGENGRVNMTLTRGNYTVRSTLDIIRKQLEVEE